MSAGSALGVARDRRRCPCSDVRRSSSLHGCSPAWPWPAPLYSPAFAAITGWFGRAPGPRTDCRDPGRRARQHRLRSAHRRLERQPRLAPHVPAPGRGARRRSTIPTHLDRAESAVAVARQAAETQPVALRSDRCRAASSHSWQLVSRLRNGRFYAVLIDLVPLVQARGFSPTDAAIVLGVRRDRPGRRPTRLQLDCAAHLSARARTADRTVRSARRPRPGSPPSSRAHCPRSSWPPSWLATPEASSPCSKPRPSATVGAPPDSPGSTASSTPRSWSPPRSPRS